MKIDFVLWSIFNFEGVCFFSFFVKSSLFLNFKLFIFLLFFMIYYKIFIEYKKLKYLIFFK